MGWHPDSIWTPELAPLAAVLPNVHAYYDPIACMAASAQVTQTIALGTSVTEPARNHPAQLARAWLTLDHLSGGRSILGIGAGEGENITPYGIPFDRPAGRLEQPGNSFTIHKFTISPRRVLPQNRCHTSVGGRMTASFFTVPGRVVRNCSADRTN